MIDKSDTHAWIISLPVLHLARMISIGWLYSSQVAVQFHREAAPTVRELAGLMLLQPWTNDPDEAALVPLDDGTTAFRVPDGNVMCVPARGRLDIPVGGSVVRLECIWRPVWRTWALTVDVRFACSFLMVLWLATTLLAPALLLPSCGHGRGKPAPEENGGTEEDGDAEDNRASGGAAQLVVPPRHADQSHLADACVHPSLCYLAPEYCCQPPVAKSEEPKVHVVAESASTSSTSHVETLQAKNSRPNSALADQPGHEREERQSNRSTSAVGQIGGDGLPTGANLAPKGRSGGRESEGASPQATGLPSHAHKELSITATYTFPELRKYNSDLYRRLWGTCDRHFPTGEHNVGLSVGSRIVVVHITDGFPVFPAGSPALTETQWVELTNRLRQHAGA